MLFCTYPLNVILGAGVLESTGTNKMVFVLHQFWRVKYVITCEQCDNNLWIHMGIMKCSIIKIKYALMNYKCYVEIRLCTIWYLSENQLKLKTPEISFANSIRFSCVIVMLVWVQDAFSVGYSALQSPSVLRVQVSSESIWDSAFNLGSDSFDLVRDTSHSCGHSHGLTSTGKGMCIYWIS